MLRAHRTATYAIAIALSCCGLSYGHAAEGDEGAPATERTLEVLILGSAPDAPTADDVLRGKAKWGEGVSLGTTSTGELAHGIAIPLDRGPVQVLPTHGERGHHYVSANLMRFLLDVGTKLRARYPEIVIYTGDGSYPTGGDLPGHASHNCGRDVDLAFFTVDEAGEPTAGRRFVRCKAPDDCGNGLAFDVERSWAMVELRLRDPAQEVQYIFIFDPLREAILAHARSLAADAEWVERAEKVLRQPSDSARHDDHFHVRVTCSLRDRLAGCLNRGPQWSWAELHVGALSYFVDALLAEADERPRQRNRVYELIGEREARVAAAPLLAHALGSSTDDLEAALDTLERTGVTGESYAYLLSALALVEDPRSRRRLIALVGQSKDPRAASALAALRSRGKEESATAVRALGRLDQRAAVPALVAFLDHPSESVRDLALEHLRRSTNQLGPEPADGTMSTWWATWWSENREGTREEWWLDGFRAQGIAMRELEDPVAISDLIALQQSKHAFLADNAHRVLMRTVGYWMTPTLPQHTRHRRWQKWWRRNAWRYESDPEPSSSTLLP